MNLIAMALLTALILGASAAAPAARIDPADLRTLKGLVPLMTCTTPDPAVSRQILCSLDRGEHFAQMETDVAAVPGGAATLAKARPGALPGKTIDMRKPFKAFRLSVSRKKQWWFNIDRTGRVSWAGILSASGESRKAKSLDLKDPRVSAVLRSELRYWRSRAKN